MPAPSPSRRQLGDAIRRLRQENGLTLHALSKRAGMHVTYLSRIERYHSSPTWDKICDIVDALGITLDDLVKAVEREAASGPGKSSRRS